MKNLIIVPVSVLLGSLLFTMQVGRSVHADTQAGTAASERAGIQAAYDGMGDAFGKHDIPRLMTYFDPGYVNIDEKGHHLDKEQTHKKFETQLSQIKSVKGHWVIMNVVPEPDGAHVEMRMHSAGTGTKKLLFLTFTGSFTDDLWVQDVWVHNPAGWQLQRRHTLKDDLQTHTN